MELTTQPQRLTVQMWRPYLLFLLFITSILVVGALDIVYFKKVLDFEISADKAWIFSLFKFFMLGCGGVIFFQTLWYVIFPPVMMMVDENGVSFGTGFRYNLFTIPGHFVEQAAQEMFSIHSLNLTSQFEFIGAIVVRFKPHPSIPSWKATSIGISYYAYALGLTWYMQNQRVRVIIASIESFQKSDAWKVPPGIEFESQKKVGFQSVAPSKNNRLPLP